MFGNAILNIIIGVIFIFLLYSLLATIVQELLATQLAFRAKVLEKAILRMLEDGKSTSKYLLANRIKGFADLLFRRNRLTKNGFAAAFYAHPLMKYLAEDNYYSKPAYLASQNFSKIVTDLLQGVDRTNATKNTEAILPAVVGGSFTVPPILLADAKNPAAKALKSAGTITQNACLVSINPQTQLFLKNLLTEAGGDMERFRLLLERWFDDTMERASGWYKRYTQAVLLSIGLFLAITFNVDTLSIIKKLEQDPKLQEQVVQAASRYVDTHSAPQGPPQTIPVANDSAGLEALRQKNQALLDSVKSLLNADIAQVNDLLALGWQAKPEHDHHFLFIDWGGFLCFSCSGQKGFSAIIGWIITALAISLGAPFWFDLLSKLMRVRGAGIKILPDGSSEASAKVQQAPAAVIISSTNPAEEAIG